MSTEIKETWNEYNEPFIYQRADPYVMKAPDGTYYFTASVPAYDKIVLRHSKTLQGLKDAEEVTIWEKHESGEMSKHIWAPEMHYIFGKFYIYFAAGERDDIWKIRPFVLECQGEDPLKDKWVELGKMNRADDDQFSFEAFSLDATIFENKGKYYYVWAEKVSVGPQISNLYIAEMESANKLKTVQVLLTTPDYDWERIGFWVNEGPAVLKHDGKLFLTFSCSATGACYCMGMLTADENDDVLDPRSWSKDRYPVCKTDYEKKVFGPGHNCFVKSDDNSKDYCVFHARSYEEIVGDPLYDPNRHALLMEITYDETGRPVFEFQKQ